MQAGTRAVPARVCLSSAVDWVPATVATLQRLQRTDEARELAERELAQAIAYGAPRRHGIAVATRAGLDPPLVALDGLGEAIAILEGAHARLDQARACVEASGLSCTDSAAATPLARRCRTG